MRRRSRQIGFTLLETLVAFSITSVSLGLLYQIHSASAQAVSRAVDFTLVSDLAQSLLDEAAAGNDSSSRERSGSTASGYRWNVLIEPYERGGTPARAESSRSQMAFSLQRISVAVSWGPEAQERIFVLETLKPVMAAADEETP